MRFDAITRKSGFMAILLAIIIVVATILRASLAPFDMEIAEVPFRERVFSKIVAGILFIITSIIVGRLFLQLGLSKSYCTLPIPIYCAMACGVALSPHTLSAASLALLFTYGIYLITKSATSNNEMNSLLLGSMFLGALPLIYPPCVVLVAIIPMVILLYTLSLRQSVVMVIGWLLPLLFASYAMWYGGSSFLLLASNIVESITTNSSADIATPPYGAIAIGIVAVAIIVWGIVYSTYKRNSSLPLVRIRKNIHLFIAIAALMVGMLLLPGGGLRALPLMALPLTILLSFSLSITPMRDSTLAYWLLLLITFIHLLIE